MNKESFWPFIDTFICIFFFPLTPHVFRLDAAQIKVIDKHFKDILIYMTVPKGMNYIYKCRCIYARCQVWYMGILNKPIISEFYKIIELQFVEQWHEGVHEDESVSFPPLEHAVPWKTGWFVCLKWMQFL